MVFLGLFFLSLLRGVGENETLPQSSAAEVLRSVRQGEEDHNGERDVFQVGYRARDSRILLQSRAE